MMRDMFPVAKIMVPYTENYELSDEMADLMIAVFGIAEVPFRPECYDRLIKTLKDRCDYSVMNNNASCLYASLLCVLYDNPVSKIFRYIELIQILRDAGFRSRISNMMALALLNEKNGCEARAAKALQLYHQMHHYHGLITGEDDYLATIYLAGLKEEAGDISASVEACYKDLAKGGFIKGNALQTLSHQMMLVPEINREQILERTIEWHRIFKERRVRTNSSQITLFGLLGALDLDKDSLITVIEKRLNEAEAQKNRKQLSTLHTTAIILMSIKTHIEEEEFELKKTYILASVLLLLTGYLFREKLI